MINELILIHVTYYRHFVFVGDVRSNLLFVFFVFFNFELIFIEFDILGTNIKNKRKNYFLGIKAYSHFSNTPRIEFIKTLTNSCIQVIHYLFIDSLMQ